MKMEGYVGLLGVIIVLGCTFGYIANIVSLCRTDFKSPYKAEALRTVGVFIPPVGVVEGYITIED